MSLEIPMTKLEAVNEMLSDVGERPVNSLAGSSRLDVVRAESTLDRISRTVQIRGWWFNTEIITITVDGAGRYNMPANVVHAEHYEGGPGAPTNGRTRRLVVRSAVLYDVNNATDVFVGGDPVDILIHRLLPYEDLPSSARDYIYAAASVRNQSRAFGSRHIDADLRAQAEVALAQLNEEDIDASELDQTYSSHFVTMMHNP